MSAREVGSGLGGLTPRSEPVLLTLMSRIQDATARMSKVCDNADEIGDRVFGTIPQVTSVMVEEGSPTYGMMSVLHAAADALHERITRLEDAMRRLNQL